ncbi:MULTISPECIES: endonuclease V [Dyadobacter]|uniref:Endonuclease V n=1 Tax=Dyadobacter chenhuakuii TaxID=2909339 RepID=A0ABY4XJ98_9BACT|nr:MULTISPECIES: endonuclease V [Dyadobacter]MCE7071722.1 endonuclease V [Dyadobacter sp. CY327]MCF2496452.1 endonuclease V [Dyadobacter chenhuakuii]USJ30509.1 endonuclease V [Dyadobacter chenhuakuii]
MNNNIETPESNYGQLTIAEATAIQEKLKGIVKLSPMEGEIKTIAGADISLDLYSDTVYAGMVVLSYPDLKPISYSLVKTTNIFPYVPGFLAFREIPGLLKVYEQLPVKPDCIMFDGNGILHARRMGIATHFGVLTDSVTMGCAKKKLAGIYADPGETRGDYSLVTDRGDTIGFALRSKNNVKPVFISPGHKMSLKDSMDITMQCLGKHRLPEPTRKAHEFVNRFRIGELKEGYHELEQWGLF